MSAAAAKIELETSSKPDVFAFHDYREYLQALIHHLKLTRRLSTRKIARESGVSESYISMVISGGRTLSNEQLEKLAPVLGLERSEISFLAWLIEIEQAQDPDERFEVLKKIQRFHGYQSSNPLEIETYKYLGQWYHVAIREMAVLPGFQADPKWIQKRLRYKVGLPEIKKGLEFLLENGFLTSNEAGQVRASEKLVQCKTGVLKPALIKFHSEMLNLAGTSLTEVPNPERNVSAFTGAIPAEKMSEVRAILDEARQKIIALAEASEVEKKDSVYHFGFLAFPLTKKGGAS